jgi:hypothetical protein
MTIDELKAAIASKAAESTALKAKIQVNTDAARKINEENRVLMKQRHDVEREKRDLEHDLKKAEKAE